jgi:hypothetical protein
LTPEAVKIACTWWNRQANGTYWQLNGSYVVAGIPGLVQMVANFDHEGFDGTVSTDQTAAEETFTFIEKPTEHVPYSVTMIAVTRNGYLRTLNVRESGPKIESAHYSIALGHFGNVRVMAPLRSEISHVQTVQGLCSQP